MPNLTLAPLSESGLAWRYVRLVGHPPGCACWRGCDTCRRGTAEVAVWAGCIRTTVLCAACAAAHRAVHREQLELFGEEETRWHTRPGGE